MKRQYETYPPLDHVEIERGRFKVPSSYLGDKLIISRENWNTMVQNEEIIIPEGSWGITDHPSRQHPASDPIYTATHPMSPEQIARWHSLGLRTDTVGRPLHPRAAEVLPVIGMFTHPGAHRRYGPQGIGNFGLRRIRNDVIEYAAVGVEREEGSRLRWGLPGGYAELGESAKQAASRELAQEVGIFTERLGNLAISQIITPPHPFWKNTLHAWTREEYIFATSIDNPELEGAAIQIGDTKEVKEARWMSVEEITTHPDFLGAHRDQVLEYEEFLKNDRVAILPQE